MTKQFIKSLQLKHDHASNVLRLIHRRFNLLSVYRNDPDKVQSITREILPLIDEVKKTESEIDRLKLAFEGECVPENVVTVAEEFYI